MTDIIYLTDRTTIETDWECGQQRFWYREFDGTGIVPANEPVYFQQGRDIHESLAGVLTGGPPRYLPIDPSNLQAAEANQRHNGWVAAWARWVWPALREEFEVLKVEWEIVLDRSPLWIACTPDVVLRSKITGGLVVWDFKSVGMLTKAWFDHWPYAVQHHINQAAVEEELGEPVDYAQIIGLVKGQPRDGRLAHPYVWAWSDGSDWSTDYYEAKRKGMVARPVWEYPEGIEAWVDRLGEDVAKAQFPFSAKIIKDDRLLAAMVEVRRRRESDVAAGLAIYEPRFSHCTPTIGSPCPYRTACHNATVNADPLGSGLYTRRIPHHDMERL